MSSFNTDVFKEPRGFIRCLQCGFAFVSFLVVCNFSASLQYDVHCAAGGVRHVEHNFSYPFNLGYNNNVSVSCPSGNKTSEFEQSPPGDFSSGAQFYVATGAIAFLTCVCMLYVYVCMDEWYSREDGKSAAIDFVITVLMAVLWLAVFASWISCLNAMKSIIGEADWLFSDKMSACYNSDSSMINANKTDESGGAVTNCKLGPPAHFAGANVAVVMAFINCFLWTSSLWFVYKETRWFKARYANERLHDSIVEGQNGEHADDGRSSP